MSSLIETLMTRAGKFSVGLTWLRKLISYRCKGFCSILIYKKQTSIQYKSVSDNITLFLNFVPKPLILSENSDSPLAPKLRFGSALAHETLFHILFVASVDIPLDANPVIKRICLIASVLEMQFCSFTYSWCKKENWKLKTWNRTYCM